jgi:hypothetical protein
VGTKYYLNFWALETIKYINPQLNLFNGSGAVIYSITGTVNGITSSDSKMVNKSALIWINSCYYLSLKLPINRLGNFSHTLAYLHTCKVFSFISGLV